MSLLQQKFDAYILACGNYNDYFFYTVWHLTLPNSVLTDITYQYITQLA